jgi:hypothetical protein
VEKIFDSLNNVSIFTIVNLFLTLKFKTTWQQRKKPQRKKLLQKRKLLRKRSKFSISKEIQSPPTGGLFLCVPFSYRAAGTR